MIKLYQSDIKRNVYTTPTVNVSGEIILAKLYKGTEFKGILNTVKPDPETASAVLTIDNDSGGDVDITVTILGKMRWEDTWTQIHQEVVSALGNGTPTDYTVSFDQSDYDDIRLEYSGVVANVVVSASTIENSPFSSLTGVVVGGDAGVQITIPCDARAFESGDEYSVVFEAEQTGLIGKERAVVFGKDGYSVSTTDETS
jgi:hypothetical protein